MARRSGRRSAYTKTARRVAESGTLPKGLKNPKGKLPSKLKGTVRLVSRKQRV